MSLNGSILGNTTGASRAVQGQSASSFASALGFGVIASVAQLIAFMLLKDQLPSIYQPKSFLVPARQRSKPVPAGIWRWIKPLFEKADDDFLRRCGLDAYFLSRYLYVLLKILLPLSLVILPILLPINATGGNNILANVEGTGRNVTQGLDVLTMSNIQPKYYSRYWAHCILAIGAVVWTCYVIVQELRYFIRVRQKFLTSPQHRLRASASTVLVRSLPNKYNDPDTLQELFDVYPGGIRNIWVTRNYTQLVDLIEERNDIAKELENAEAQLIKKCWESHQKNLKGNKNNSVPVTNGNGVHGLDGVNEKSTKALNDEGISANNPGQVHHTVDDAIDAMNRSDIEDEEEVLAKQHLLGRGLDAVNQGMKNLGRGIGEGIGQIGQIGSRIKGRQGKDTGDSSDVSGLTRFMSRRRGKLQQEHDQVSENFESQGPVQETELAEPAPSSSEFEPSLTPGRQSTEKPSIDKEAAFDLYYDQDNHLQPRWQQFIEQKDRPTMKVKPKVIWMPSIINPWAVKVDTIYHCRKELARLNRLIENLQEPENERKYPPMKSAFIQFNNQAAAHMACQSLAHQTPTFMTPRMIEVAPNDVIWKNMAVPGWAAIVRRGVVFIICVGLILAWTPMIAVASAFSQIDALRKTQGFEWLDGIPSPAIPVIQGIVPVVLVALLIFLLGLILRVVVKREGAPTTMRVELSVQKYFFVFAFSQYFLVVTIASAFSLIFTTITASVTAGNLSVFLIPQLLAQNIPSASNYFLSQILLQSLSQSASGLLQLGPLWFFVWRKLRNKSARKRFSARTSLSTMSWGTTYPLYTAFSCIAIIYSVISPLILPLSMVGFGIWWISTRYQMLYIYNYTTDTGGLLFPMALKQLFTGLFVMELFLIGFFIIISTGSSDNQSNTAAVIPMTVVMVITLIATIIFYFVLKSNFDPLLEYLPITLEDDALARDKEFEQLLAQSHGQEEETEMMQGVIKNGANDHGDDDNDDDEQQDKNRVSDIETAPKRDTLSPDGIIPDHNARSRSSFRPTAVKRGSWADRRTRSKAWSSRSPSARFSAMSIDAYPTDGPTDMTTTSDEARVAEERHATERALERPQEPSQPARLGNAVVGAAGGALNLISRPLAAPINFVNPNEEWTVAQQQRFEAEANQIYGGIPDDLENLTKEQRDVLLSRAFRHTALRAKRPCIWIPRDELGVADDEVKNTALFTKYIWISDERQVLDDKGRFMYKAAPPDFDEVDLIQL